jgi:hypothetical protein
VARPNPLRLAAPPAKPIWAQRWRAAGGPPFGKRAVCARRGRPAPIKARALARASSRRLAALPRPGRLLHRLCPPRAGRCPVRRREVQPEPPEAAGRTSSTSCTPAGHPRRRRLTGTSQLLEVRASYHGQPSVCPSLNFGRCRRLPSRVSSCTSPPPSPLPIPSVTRARSRH